MHALDDSAVLRRTHKGQHRVVSGSLAVDARAHRLLLLVNGYTPLSSLLDRLENPEEARASVETLIRQGLIETTAEAH
jgi:hypothetical protein